MDSLQRWRREFPILDTCTYLVSHSLGAMPRAAADSIAEFVDAWNRRGVRAWEEGWWNLGEDTGNLLAPILGVQPGTISMHQNVTVALSIIASCFSYEGRRSKIVLSDLEFPSNTYLFEGFRRYGADVVYVPCEDPIRVPIDRLLEEIDDTTVLVPLSLVLFRSSCIQDAGAVVEKAHRVGAHVILDVYQAAGTVPLDLHTLGADFAVGGSVKWLCGGPGAGYLYVHPDVAIALEPAVTGWAAHVEPFAFERGPTRLAPPPYRFQSGTPNVPALYSARAGYRIIGEIGVPAIREKSLRLTRRLINAALECGFGINSPLDDRERGGTVTLDVPNAAAVAEALIQRDVMIDFRPGAGIRMAPHFYNTEADIDRAIAVLSEIVEAAHA